MGIAALAALANAAPTETVKEERAPIEARAACSTAVKLAAGSNPFTGRTLHANSAYAAEISTAMASVTDTGIQAQGASVAKVGTFLWL